MNDILNAQITSTELGEYHGCLTVHLIVEGNGWGCGYGGYVLDRWCAEPGRYESRDGYGAIIELMKTLEVKSWEGLRGKYVRVEIECWGGNIIKIGHLFKNKWFSWNDYFEEVKKVNEHED